MKKAVTVISILCVVIIAVGVLIVTGVIDVKGIFGKIGLGGSKASETAAQASESPSDETTSAQSQAAAWISYMDTCVLIDRNGNITGTCETPPENVTQLSGMDITRMVIGAPVEVDDRDSFDYGLLVANKMAAVGIPDKGEVFISADKSAIVYIKNVKILLGKNEDVLEKLEALRKFYSKVIELDGTLDMQELDRNNMGYTFKVNGAETEVMGEDETGDGTSEETDAGDEVAEEYYEEDDGEDDGEYTGDEEYAEEDGEED